MPPEEFNRFIKAVQSRLGEYFDGFVVVGFHPVRGGVVIIRHNGADPAMAPRTHLALNTLLHAAMMQPMNATGPAPGPEGGS